MLHDSSSPPSYQCQSFQHYSLVNHFNDDEVEDLDPFFHSQHYSPAQGSCGPSIPVQDDSLIEEVVVIPKKCVKKTSKSQDDYKGRR
ncbi:hypothetical protein Tco_1298128 [Tanacetum coccineum]